MKKFWMIGIAGVCCLALGACSGESSDGDDHGASSAPATTSSGGGNPLVGDNASTFSTGSVETPADVAASTQEPASETPAVSDATAEDAFKSYMDLLIAGDFRAAADLCIESDGSAELRKLANNMDNVAQEAGEGMRDIVVGKMAEDLRRIEWSKIADDGALAVFEITRTGATNAIPNVEVQLIGTRWRVVPPAKGFPS